MGGLDYNVSSYLGSTEIILGTTWGFHAMKILKKCNFGGTSLRISKLNVPNSPVA